MNRWHPCANLIDRLRDPDVEKGFEMAERIAFELNRQPRTVEVAPETPLLYALRNEFGLNNPHFVEHPLLAVEWRRACARND